MLSGVLLTGIIALVVGNTSLIQLMVQETARGGYSPTLGAPAAPRAAATASRHG
jgi:hypothetical protein